MKKLLIIMLCAALILSNIQAVPLWAEEAEEGVTQETLDSQGSDENQEDENIDNDAGESGQNDIDLTNEDNSNDIDQNDIDDSNADDLNTDDEDQNSDDGDGGEQEVRKLSLSTNNISFGTITQGDEVIPQTFSLLNEGNVPVEIAWSQSDVEGTFVFDTLSGNGDDLQPGEALECSVSLAEGGLEPGDYSGVVAFQDSMVMEDAEVLSLSVKVLKKEETSEEKDEPEEEKEAPEETTQAPEKKTEAPEETTQAPEKKTETPEAKTEKQKDKPAQPADGKNTFSIKASCSPKRAGYASGGGVYKKGGKTVLTAFGNDGYEFTGWYLDGKQVSKKISLSVINISSNKKFVAKFSHKAYKIVVNSGMNKYGTVSGGGYYAKGETAILTAVPEEGYVLKGWYEQGKLVSRQETLEVKNIKSDHKLKAAFKKGKHKVSIRTYPSGTGTVTGAGDYDDQADVKIKAAPKKGYVFKAFILNNQILTVKDAYTLKDVDRDLSITACFAKEDDESFNIVSGISNKGGIISPSGSLTISKDAAITYTITPENGYAIQEVAVDGKKVGAVNSYTFKNIGKDHTISVAFAPKEGNVNNVKKDKIITVEEAKKVASAELIPAAEGEEGRVSNVITPEMYEKMKDEGTLEDAMKIQKQNVVGMNDTDNLGDKVGGYNYDEAEGLYQVLDLTPETAKKMLDAGDDSAILKAAYEESCLDILINNQYLVPGKEEKSTSAFEENDTVNNMLEFVSGLLTKEDKIKLLEGGNIAINVGITKGDDLDKEDKKLLNKAGARIDECFYMTIMKQIEDGEPETVTELQRPIEVVLKVPKGSDANCIVRLHKGRAEILKDIDDDPETITIRTDKFSPYAFGEDGVSSGIPVIPIALAAAALAAIIGVVIFTRKRRENA